MKEGARNLLVGLFIVASFVALGVLMVWFGETPTWLGGSEWTLRITGVHELSGVGEGSLVNLNGVQIGRVKKLEFENLERPDQGVVIVTRIKNVFSVPQGAIAKVYGATLGFGTGHIDIRVEPGVPAEPLDKEFAFISGEMHSIIGELISKDLVNSVERTIRHIGDLSEATEPVMDHLAELLKQRSVAEVNQPGAAAQGVMPNISTAIERIDTLLANINAVLGDENLQGNVKAAVGDLKSATEELRETIELWKTESQRVADNMNAGIDQTEENLDQSFAKLNQVLDNLDGATKSMAGLLHQVAEGQGTAGLFARDERLYEAAVLSLERLDELIGTLQRIAGKIEEDGHITIGRKTPVGTFTKDFPIGAQAPEKP
ncbi:MAG: MlaD family protein [Phycisphaerae bacterium]